MRSHSIALTMVAFLAAAACQPDETRGTPAPPGADTLRLIAISSGHHFTCGLATDSTAWCWGANQYGQLGAPAGDEMCLVDFLAHGPCSQAPVQVSGGHRFAAIDAGSDHACALTADSAVFCWGNNSRAQLGGDPSGTVCPVARYNDDGSAPDPCERVPLQVVTAERFTAIAAADRFTCGLSRDGGAFCWGDTAAGARAYDNGRNADAKPWRIPTTARFTQIDADGGYGCGRSTGNEVDCWRHQALDSVRSVSLPGGIAAISVGWSHACALSANGVATCWGENDSGQLGIGVATPRFSRDTSRHEVPGLRFRFVRAGFSSTCGATVDGAFYCWGDGSEVGSKATDECFHVDAHTPCALKPVELDVRDVVSVSGGIGHVCALTAAGAAFCWGMNDAGPVGYGRRTTIEIPTAVLRKAH